MKVSELTGAALDWGVAMAENWAGADFEVRPYSTDWAQGGPIIEREYIWLEINEGQCYAHKNGLEFYEGETPLIAAMRCYVASKLGAEVEIPKELT